MQKLQLYNKSERWLSIHPWGTTHGWTPTLHKCQSFSVSSRYENGHWFCIIFVMRTTTKAKWVVKLSREETLHCTDVLSAYSIKNDTVQVQCSTIMCDVSVLCAVSSFQNFPLLISNSCKPLLTFTALKHLSGTMIDFLTCLGFILLSSH